MKRSKTERNANRRAAYQYYRSCGYSAKFAAKIRGRTKSVWSHYFETGKYEGRKAPVLKSSKTDRARIRRELREVYGLSAKIAGNWSRLKEETLRFRLDNLRKYVAAVSEVTGDSEKEVRKQLAAQLKDAKTQQAFWENWRDWYSGIVGFPG